MLHGGHRFVLPFDDDRLADAGRAEFRERLERCLRVDEGVARAESFREYVLDAGVIADHAERTAGDNARSLGCRHEAEFRRFEFDVNLVRDRSFDERHSDHVALRRLRRLLHGSLHFVRFTRAHPHLALAVAHDDDRAETHAAAALHDARDAIDRERRLGELGWSPLTSVALALPVWILRLGHDSELRMENGEWKVRMGHFLLRASF